jgi:hypothetical protein
VLDLSLWKYSFELVTRELDLARKKKQALDSLFASDKISQSTYDYLEGELAEAITDLENHLKTLTDKMNVRTQDLESQMNTLEVFLASLEIHHAAGDVDDETYERQNNAILLGLEATRQELNDIKSSLSRTVSESAEAPVAEAEPGETAEVSDPLEVEEEEESEVEEPTEYELAEPKESSQEMTTESAITEPAESEVLPSVFNSEQPSLEHETTSED